MYWQILTQDEFKLNRRYGVNSFQERKVWHSFITKNDEKHGAIEINGKICKEKDVFLFFLLIFKLLNRFLIVSLFKKSN